MKMKAKVSLVFLSAIMLFGLTVQAEIENPADFKLLSGYEFQSADTKSLQDDDFQNPGMLWVDQGEALFNEPAGADGKSCASCHRDGLEAVAASFPKENLHLRQLVNLTRQIQHCRSDHQKASPLDYEGEIALALTAYLGYQSRGLSLRFVSFSSEDKALDVSFANGRRYFMQRKGQLNLACKHCHDDSVGKMLRGDLISQGHGNGYPIYRLEWQALGSLHRRFRSCDVGVRAEPKELGSKVYTDLEVYLKHRAQGLKIETPAVRR